MNFSFRNAMADRGGDDLIDSDEELVNVPSESKISRLRGDTVIGIKGRKMPF